MVQANSFYYKETPGIRNVSTREKFTVITDDTSIAGVTYEGRCQLPLDQALQRLDQPIWQLWRNGVKTIEVDSIEYTSGVHNIKGISERTFGEVWDDRVAIFGDTIVSELDNLFSLWGGATDEYANGGDILNFDNTEPISYSFWIKPSVIGTAKALLNKIEASPSFKGFQIEIGTDNKIYYWLLNSGSNYAAIKGDSLIDDISLWYHIVVTNSGGSNAASFKIYVNAVLDTPTVINDTLTATTNNTRDFNILRRSDNTRYTNARLDEIAVYDIELTPTQVLEIYNAGLPNNLLAATSASALVAWWRFTQDDKDNFPTLADYSLSGFDLTAINMEVGDIQGDVPT